MKPDETNNKLHAFIDGPPQVKGSDIGLPANHPFAGFDVVSQYTDDDAVKDGTLVDITAQCNVEGAKIKRVLISRALFEEALVARGEDIAGVSEIRNPLRHLLGAFSRAVNLAGKEENEYWWFDLGLRERVKACHNGQGRITFCYPSED